MADYGISILKCHVFDLAHLRARTIHDEPLSYLPRRISVLLH